MAYPNRRETGPVQNYDVIGDIHGCIGELEVMLAKLGYVDGAHPEGRQVVFLGDLVDRGPDSPAVLRRAMDMVARGSALAVRGNHEHKLIRALEGRDIQLSYGLEVTMEQLASESGEFRQQVKAFCEWMPHHLVLDGGRLVVAHAGLAEHLHGVDSKRAQAFALFGDTTGALDGNGLPVRLPWQNDYRGEATVLYGHTPTRTAAWTNNTMCLDTGCVFGNKLSALRYPERELVEVPALKEWYPARAPLL